MKRKPTQKEIEAWHVFFGNPNARLSNPAPRTDAKEKSIDARKTKRRLCPTEDDEQKAFVKWFEMSFPGVLIYAIPNGGSRNLLEAVKMKRTGTKRSIPDLHIPEWRLYIEMKRTMFSDKTSDAFLAQLEMHNHLRTKCKETVFLAYGCEDAVRQVNQFRLDRQLEGSEVSR